MSTMQDAARQVVYSLTATILTLVVCFSLLPRVLITNTGLSYFSIQKITVLPFTVGMLAASYFIARAARVLPRGSEPTLRRLEVILCIIALLIVCVLATPYSVNPLLSVLHTIAATTLFVCELAAAAWLLYKTGPNRIKLLLMCCQLVGVVLAYLAYTLQANVMLTAELLIQYAFGTLLVIACNQLVRSHHESVELSIGWFVIILLYSLQAPSVFGHVRRVDFRVLGGGYQYALRFR